MPRKSNPVLILCYHAIAELSDDPILRDYGTPPEAFMRQIDDLARRGCAFLGRREIDRYRAEKLGVPRKAVLLTLMSCIAMSGDRRAGPQGPRHTRDRVCSHGPQDQQQ